MKKEGKGNLVTERRTGGRRMKKLGGLITVFVMMLTVMVMPMRALAAESQPTAETPIVQIGSFYEQEAYNFNGVMKNLSGTESWTIRGWVKPWQVTMDTAVGLAPTTSGQTSFFDRLGKANNLQEFLQWASNTMYPMATINEAYQYLASQTDFFQGAIGIRIVGKDGSYEETEVFFGKLVNGHAIACMIYQGQVQYIEITSFQEYVPEVTVISTGTTHTETNTSDNTENDIMKPQEKPETGGETDNKPPTDSGVTEGETGDTGGKPSSGDPEDGGQPGGGLMEGGTEAKPSVPNVPSRPSGPSSGEIE